VRPTRAHGGLLSSLITRRLLSGLYSPTRRAIPSPRFLVIASRARRSGAVRQLRVHVVDVIAEIPANSVISRCGVTQ
jgi:hypothetical protein